MSARRMSLLPLILAAASCAPREAAVAPGMEIAVSGGTTLDYVWQDGDTWRFLAWAILDSENGEGYEAIALTSGFMPDQAPATGSIVTLPLDPSMRDALEDRLASARLVREATGQHGAGHEEESEASLREAITADPGWSVPRYDLALLLIGRMDAGSARAVLEPVSGKPRAALLLGLMAWEEGDVMVARARLEAAVAAEYPPAEALASAAIAYMVTGEDYLAGRLWTRLLQDASAPSELRLMAVRFCLGMYEPLPPGFDGL